MISTHILDTSRGLPAEGVRVVLEKKESENWLRLSEGFTNSDGRFVFPNSEGAGQFRIWFEIEGYFAKYGTPSFFLDLPLAFQVSDASRKHHVPLLLSPYGLSSYRGS